MSEAWTHLLSAHGGVKVKLTQDRWQVFVKRGEDEWRFAASGGLGDGEAPSNSRRTIGELQVDPKSRECLLDGKPVKLTPREYDLLSVLIEDPTRVFTKDELTEEIWGAPQGNTRTADRHVAALRRKLDGRYVETIWGVGYRLLPLEI